MISVTNMRSAINDHNYFLHLLSHLFPKIWTSNLSLNPSITLSYSYLDPSNIEWKKSVISFIFRSWIFYSLSILGFISSSYPKSQKPSFNFRKNHQQHKNHLKYNSPKDEESKRSAGTGCQVNIALEHADGIVSPP